MGGVTFAVWAQLEIADAYKIASAEDVSADLTLAKLLPKLEQAKIVAEQAADHEDELYKEILQLRSQVQELKDRLDQTSS